MKLHNHILTLLAVLALFLVASCSPEDFGFGKKTYSPEDLVEGKAYTVTVEGNIVKLQSKISDCTPLWVTPSGRSEEQNVTLELPFAGEYSVTFGVETPGGIVYGDPYKFSLAKNDFTLLSDDKWFYLADKNFKKGDALPDEATLIAGISKKWVPIAKDYGIGRVDCPLSAVTPYDVMNNGKGFTDEEKANNVYKDIYFGSENWAPNYNYGMSVLVDQENSAYLDSWMEFSMDAQNGCVVKMYRGESGLKGSSTGTNLVGKFNLNLNDAKKPTITFTDAYVMHPNNWDDVCANYATDIQIIELTPYLLQTVTKRTNAEGNWYIVESFVSKEVEEDPTIIPKDELELVEATSPKLPTFEDLETKLFTTDINGATFVGTSMTFLANDEGAYDWYWWNGGSSEWQSVVKGDYTKSWAPKWGSEVADMEFVFDRSTVDGRTTYKYTFDKQNGTFTIKDNKLVFDKEVSFFTVTGDSRTIELKGKEWQVIKCDPGTELILGVPETKDANGKVNSYRTVCLIYKPVSSQSGPTVVPFTAENLKYNLEKDSYLRCQLYNPWGGGGDAIDPARVKVKKNQKLNVTVKLNGFTFEKPAKMLLCLNFGSETEWEPACFEYSRAITVNSNGTYTVSWTNDTGETCNWSAGTSALTVTMQYVGYATLADDTEDGWKQALTIESVTIE